MPTVPHSKMSSESLPIPRQIADADSPRKDQILVDEASLESFPASDPPAWTATHAGAPTGRALRTETPREIRARLRSDVEALSVESVNRVQVLVDYVTTAFLDAELPVVKMPLPRSPDEENVEAILRGTRGNGEIVVGARYDGLGDTASGIAVLLGLARMLGGRRFARTVRLVAFANGGSAPYAMRLAEQRLGVHAMFDLENVGFHADRQARETPSLALRIATAGLLTPWKGQFIAFVGDRHTRPLARAARDAFAKATELEARAVTMPSFMPLVAASDAWSFMREGFDAVVLTDSGPRRIACVHDRRELPEVLNYDSMADVVFGLASVVARVAGEEAGVT